jgi:hypothetical protein
LTRTNNLLERFKVRVKIIEGAFIAFIEEPLTFEIIWKVME